MRKTAPKANQKPRNSTTLNLRSANTERQSRSHLLATKKQILYVDTNWLIFGDSYWGKFWFWTLCATFRSLWSKEEDTRILFILSFPCLSFFALTQKRSSLMLSCGMKEKDNPLPPGLLGSRFSSLERNSFTHCFSEIRQKISPGLSDMPFLPLQKGFFPTLFRLRGKIPSGLSASLFWSVQRDSFSCYFSSPSWWLN